MKSMPKWFLIPPAVAALLVMGTLSMQGGSTATVSKPPKVAAADNPASTEVAEPATAKPTAKRDVTPLPRTPDLWEMASALIGVLLLGVGGVLLLRRLRQGARSPHGAALIGLRQTLRLSAKQAIHAIEFDERILLVGEGDKGLTLLETGRLPERAADEAEIASRTALATAAAAATDEADDDGAVPKNLAIPRPSQALPRRLPTPPANTAAKHRTENPALAEFRNLLQKAGRS